MSTANANVVKVRLQGTDSYAIDSDGKITNASNKEVAWYFDRQTKVPYIKVGQKRERIDLTEKFIKSHFTAKYVEENQLAAAGAGGNTKSKPIIVFRLDGTFVGTFRTQNEFSKSTNFEVLNNAMPPVLKGRTRHLKGYHLFYDSEYQEWLEDAKTRGAKEGDFPTELHAYYGYTLGESRKAKPSPAEVAAQKATSQPA